ncbi:hypothetical protein G4V39_04255 [Thermosulfuriphilus ammonigenes]|uniref:Uncharacterized protein n=1 Tax=Thermosulfuriphilus ammonigenes TaxID=1936021 RepID=A0A6G7PVR7_9BACT|nr:hypothetical protein [Thermosulfuriphilus ammonigenes]MBA2848303.1 hypothetical protein [Thermosulfuriphilus ammonigenes]QIJ71538.1 hypothetical protein G4V39_04255 [Thermosulfuriphilus ammonigenes]HFB83495.1 hypothetical protein [Thermodesulfatator sp.]
MKRKGTAQRLPDIQEILKRLTGELQIKFFPLHDIPEAVTWAERGYIAIHENFRTRRRHSYHVICGRREPLERFCHLVGLPETAITASEFYRFWHLTWYPDGPPPPKRRRNKAA